MHEESLKPLLFQSSKTELSIGVEIELQVLDRTSLLLTPKASEIKERLPADKFTLEFFQSTLEIISGVCHNVKDIEEDLRSSVRQALTTAHSLGLTLSSTGTHPLGDYRDRLITPSSRYSQLIDRNQWMIRRMAVYGMHIHLGMLNGDRCMRYNYFFMHFLPHILALSSSSPFWQGMHTGLSSCRPTMYESLPTAGMPYLVKDWNEFQKLYQFLLQSQSIQSIKDLWWDLRPSPMHGTLELRFCDEPATLHEAMAIVAFVHLLAHWFRDHEDEWVQSNAPLKQWIFRENKWRAIRYGLDAEIVTTRMGKTSSLRKEVEQWLKRLSNYSDQLRYGKYVDVLIQMLARGNSAARQLGVYQRTGDLLEVVNCNVKEFEDDQPNYRE